MLIDFHTHAFPDKIAARAVASLSHASGGLMPQTDGTLASLKQEMAKDGVSLAVVQSIATNPGQMRKVNDFAIQINAEPEFAAFGSVHPDAPDALEELERIHAAGLKGVKFHPEYQQFYVDDEKMRPIYRKISDLGLITLFHAGHDPGFAPPYHAMPENLLRALGWFDSPVVAAHWGGVGCGEDVVEKLCGTPIWFDLAFGYASIARPIALKILERHGAQRLLFGSDMPWHRPEWELRLLDSLELTQAERAQICWQNAAALLGL